MDKNAKEEVADLAKEKAEQVKKAASETAEKLKNMSADEAKELAKEKAEQAKKVATEAAEKLKNMSADEAKELAKEKLEKMKSLDNRAKIKYASIALVSLAAIYFIFGGSDSKEALVKDAKIFIADCMMGGEGCGKRKTELEQRQKDLGISNSEFNDLLK